MKAYRFDFSNGISDLASRTVAGGFSSMLDGVVFRDGGIASGKAPLFWKNPLDADVRRVGSSDSYMWSYRRRFYTSNVLRDYVGELWGSREHIYYSEYGGVPKKIVNGTVVDLGQERPLDPPLVEESHDNIGDSLSAMVTMPVIGGINTSAYTDVEIEMALVRYLVSTGYIKDPFVSLVLPIGEADVSALMKFFQYFSWVHGDDGKSVIATIKSRVMFFGVGPEVVLRIYLTELSQFLPTRQVVNDGSATFMNPTGTIAPGSYGYRIAPIIKGVIGAPGHTVRISVPTLQDVYGDASPVLHSSSFAIKLTWAYSKYVDGYAIFGRTEDKESLLIKLGKNVTGWVDDGSVSTTSDSATRYEPSDNKPISYIYTYVRDTNGHKDESGPSNPSTESKGGGVRTVSRPSLDGRDVSYGARVIDVTSMDITQTSPFTPGRYERLCAVDSGSANGVVKCFCGLPSAGDGNPFVAGETVKFAGFVDSYWNSVTTKVIRADGEAFFVGPDMPMPSDIMRPYGRIVFDASTPSTFVLDAPTMLCSQITLTGKITKNHTITIDNSLIGRPWGCVNIRRSLSEETTYGVTFVSASPFGTGVTINDTTDPHPVGLTGGNGISVIENMHDLTTFVISPCFSEPVSPGLLTTPATLAGKSSVYSCIAYKPEIVISNVSGVNDGDMVHVVVKNGSSDVLRGAFKVYQIAGDSAANRIRIPALLDNASVTTGPNSFVAGAITSATITVFPKENGVTHWRIYRVGDVTQWSLVKELPIEVDSFVDIVPAAALGDPPTSAYEENGIQVIFDKPIPGMTDLTKHSGMYFGVVGNTLRWTPIGKPDAWPRTFMSNQFNYRPLRLMSYGGTLFIFCEDGVYRGEGSKATVLSFSKTSAVDGCIAPRTVCLTSRGIVYLSRRGLVLFNGVSSQPILDGRVSPEFLMAPDAVQPGIRYWIMPALQSHFYAVAASNDGARGTDQSGQRDVNTINQGVTHDIIGAFHGGVYYLMYRGNNYMSHTVFTINLENPKIPCATLPYRVLDAHVSETGDLFWLVDSQAAFAQPIPDALGAQRNMSSTFVSSYTDARGIMRVGGQFSMPVASFIRTGSDDFGYPNIEKMYDYIDVYGSGAFTLRVFVDGEYIGSASGVACQSPNIDRRVKLPVGLKGQAINIEMAFEDTIKMLEHGYNLVEQSDANPSS